MNTEIANVITTEKLNEQFEFFESEDFGRLEILVINGKIYFPATESAKTLGYSNPQKAISSKSNKRPLLGRWVHDSFSHRQAWQNTAKEIHKRRKPVPSYSKVKAAIST